MISTTLFPLVEKLSTLLSAHPDHPVLVALDGRCGSGKTTLAAQLAGSFPRASRCIPMTFIFLQPAVWQTGSRSPAPTWTWSVCVPRCSPPPGPGRPSLTVPTPAGPVPTCRNNALRPNRWSSWRAVTAATPPLADCYDLKVFVACSKEEQARRLLAREGERYSGFTARWIPLEEGYFAKFQIEQTVDFILDTTC